MIRRVTLKDGPLDGKSYDVPAGAEFITVGAGRYRLTPKTGKWEPAKRAPRDATSTELQINNTRYSHVTPTVKDGDEVKAGDQIGTTGKAAERTADQ